MTTRTGSLAESASRREQEDTAMSDKKTTAASTKPNLAVQKQTVKDLPTARNPRGGFIMKDTIIIRTSH